MVLWCFSSNPSATASSGPAGTRQTSQQTSIAGVGVIAGRVVDDRGEPVARATVQAFAAGERSPQTPGDAMFLTRASGVSSTDADGRFRISGLALGEYLVAAAPAALFPTGRLPLAPSLGITFYPSTADGRQAVRVPALESGATTIQLELVRIRGVRVAGTVVSPSGRSTGGMRIMLFHRFGNFGTGLDAGVTGASGTFEIANIPPGSYRLIIGTRPPDAPVDNDEFAETTIDVQGRDLGGLSLVLSAGASMSGRVAAEPGGGVPSPVGLRVSASPAGNPFLMSMSISATVAYNGSFRMTGLSGSYRLTVSSDRPPRLAVTRVTVDGVEARGADVTLADGAHDVVIFVTPRETPRPPVDTTLSARALIEQFKAEKVFWRQFETARLIVERHDASVLPPLADWLNHEERRIRGNVAFIFAGLGDPRGFEIITGILTDRSDRPSDWPVAQRVTGLPADRHASVARQIAADRYYAVHLLGDLRDARAVPILIPLLKDLEVEPVVTWALGEIGDRRAIAPLVEALDDESPTRRVRAIYTLETLHAREAVPRLTLLLNDHRKSNFGAQVTVADAARAAIAKLR